MLADDFIAEGRLEGSSFTDVRSEIEMLLSGGDRLCTEITEMQKHWFETLLA